RGRHGGEDGCGGSVVMAAVVGGVGDDGLLAGAWSKSRRKMSEATKAL
ncbi:hypothetical protein Tco_1536307, partial [Tanacetum coccineum]